MTELPIGDGAVIVSNDEANATAERLGRGVITVGPMTSNTANISPFQVLLTADSTGRCLIQTGDGVAAVS